MARWTRQVLFGDIDAMFASAAVVANPSLVEHIIAVGSSPPRGIITAASYPARKYGVHSAMPTAHAVRLCPQLKLIPPDFALYKQLHHMMERVTQHFFPHACWTSIDEFYADVTDLQSMYASPETLGQRVKDAMVETTGLRCTIAIATGTTIAKMAANSHKPDGLAIIEPGTESEFLHAQRVHTIPGVGPKTATALNNIGVHYLRDFLNEPVSQELKRVCGPRLHRLQSLARGIDLDPVPTERVAKSMGHETTFDHDTSNLSLLIETVHGFLSTLAHDLRRDGLEARGFTIKLKDRRFAVTTRHRQFPKPTNYDSTMWQQIQPAINSLVVPGLTYRLIGLSLSDFVPSSRNLFDKKTSEAVAAMDQIIQKHGFTVIRWGHTPEK